MTRSYEIRGIMLIEDGALTYPRLVCDACQQIIEQASAANVNWDIESETAVVIHKRCDAARGSKEDMSMPLEVELLWLLGNSDKDRIVVTTFTGITKNVRWYCPTNCGSGGLKGILGKTRKLLRMG
jgi:hypothetical protein